MFEKEDNMIIYKRKQMRLINKNQKQKKLIMKKLHKAYEWKTLYCLLNTKQRRYLKDVIVLLLRHRL